MNKKQLNSRSLIIYLGWLSASLLMSYIILPVAFKQTSGLLNNYKNYKSYPFIITDLVEEQIDEGVYTDVFGEVILLDLKVSITNPSKIIEDRKMIGDTINVFYLNKETPVYYNTDNAEKMTFWSSVGISIFWSVLIIISLLVLDILLLWQSIKKFKKI